MTYTATEARSHFYELIKKSVNGHMHINIRSKNGQVVMISQEDYEGLMETLELLSVKGFAKSVASAKDDIKKGRTKSIDEVLGE